jgi:hypothetical protein
MQERSNYGNTSRQPIERRNDSRHAVMRGAPDQTTGGETISGRRGRLGRQRATASILGGHPLESNS